MAIACLSVDVLRHGHGELRLFEKGYLYSSRDLFSRRKVALKPAVLQSFSGPKPQHQLHSNLVQCPESEILGHIIHGLTEADSRKTKPCRSCVVFVRQEVRTMRSVPSLRGANC